MAIQANTHLLPPHSLPFFSGFGGRVQAAPFTGASALLDLPPPGINGLTLAWVKAWNFESSVEAFGADTFENPLNARGIPFKRKDLLGLASGKVDLEGFSLANNAIQHANIYILELIMGRVAPGAYRKIRVYGLCSSVSRSASADGNSPVEFKASFEFASPPVFAVEPEA